jgi:hypothetical protein
MCVSEELRSFVEGYFRRRMRLRQAGTGGETLISDYNTKDTVKRMNTEIKLSLGNKAIASTFCSGGRVPSCSIRDVGTYSLERCRRQPTKLAYNVTTHENA